jgi:hypothetical protein
LLSKEDDIFLQDKIQLGHNCEFSFESDCDIDPNKTYCQDLGDAFELPHGIRRDTQYVHFSAGL